MHLSRGAIFRHQFPEMKIKKSVTGNNFQFIQKVNVNPSVNSIRHADNIFGSDAEQILLKDVTHFNCFRGCTLPLKALINHCGPKRMAHS